MVDRLLSVDEDTKQLPTAVRDRLAANLLTPATTEGNAVAQAVAAQVADPSSPAGSAIADAIGAVASQVLDAQPYQDAAWTVGSAARPVQPDMATWVTKGSSSAGQLATYGLPALATLAGTTVVARSKAGEKWEHMLARDGIAPALLTFPSNTIPASGAVIVTASIPAAAAMQSYRGTVGGVIGSLTATDSTFTFTRETSGGAVVLTGATPFVPTATTAGGTKLNPSYRHTVMFLDTGKNNADDSATAYEAINAALDAEVAWLVPLVKRFLVLGMHPNTGANAAHKANVRAVNAHRSKTYGDRFLDVWTYVASGQAFVDMGITKTAGDQAQINAYEKPDSLSSDNQHFTNAFWTTFAEKVIRPRLVALGWYPSLAVPGTNSILTSDTFSAEDGPINGTGTDAALGGAALTWVATATTAVRSAGVLATSAAAGVFVPCTDANVEMAVKVVALPTTTSAAVCVLRASSTAAAQSNTSYRLTLTNAGVLTIERRSGGATTGIATSSTNVAAGDTVALRAVGSTLTAYINGVEAASVTDATIASGNYAGISVGNGVNQLDNFVLTKIAA